MSTAARTRDADSQTARQPDSDGNSTSQLTRGFCPNSASAMLSLVKWACNLDVTWLGAGLTAWLCNGLVAFLLSGPVSVCLPVMEKLSGLSVCHGHRQAGWQKNYLVCLSVMDTGRLARRKNYLVCLSVIDTGRLAGRAEKLSGLSVCH